MYKCKCGETKNYFGLPFKSDPSELSDRFGCWHITSWNKDLNFCNENAQAGCLHHKEKEKETMVDNNALFNAVQNFVSKAHDLLDEFEQDLAAIEDESEPEAPAQIVVQGRLRGDVLHLQRGTLGNYTTANVSLRMSQAEAIAKSIPDSVSFAGTGRSYLTGVEYPDGSVSIGGIALADPFGSGQPQSSRR
jgi:hypothetical protein